MEFIEVIIKVVEDGLLVGEDREDQLNDELSAQVVDGQLLVLDLFNGLPGKVAEVKFTSVGVHDEVAEVAYVLVWVLLLYAQNLILSSV